MKDLVVGFLIALFISSYIASGGPTPYQNGWTFGNTAVGPDPITDVNAGTFQGEVLDSHTPVLAEFYLDSDVHSTNMKTPVTELASESQGFVRVVRIDANANATLTSRYDVKSFPAFVLFKDGKAVNGTSGEMKKQELENWVKRELDIPVN
jgi:thioredoxin 1